ncbi:MAG: FG-GAP-like repeat-containing protein [Polyangia bacterium]
MRSLLHRSVPAISDLDDVVVDTSLKARGRTLARTGSAGVAALALVLALGAPGCTSGTSNPAGDGGTNPTGDGGTSNSDGGTVGGPVSISQILPGTGLLAGGEVITIVGDGFAEGATVLFGDRQGTGVQVLSKTQLKVTVPAGAAIGPVVLVVKNPDGSLASNGTLFSYVRVRVVLGDVMNPTYLPVGQKPVAITAADLDGDGKPDLITANEGSGDVTLLKNNQNFLTPNSWAVAVGPTSLVVGELDARTGLDVAVTCNNADGKDVGVLLNSGSGNLQAAAPFAVARNPTGIVARDLNGDGKAELIVGVRTTSQAQVLNNTTAGATASFTLGTTYALGTSPAALLLAELTGDTYPELLSANEAGNSVSVYLGAAGGMFQSKPAVTASGRPLSLAAGDLTGDGKADLIVPGFDSQQLTVLRGKGDGTFDTLAPVGVGLGPRAAAIADIDGDGKADALVLNSAGNTLDVLLGKGDGTFEPTQRLLLTATPYAMTVADLNADGKPDVAVASYDGNRVILLTNKTQR